MCIRKLATDHLPSSMTLRFMIHLVNTLLDPSYLLASFVSYHTRIWVGERCASDGVARGQMSLLKDIRHVSRVGPIATLTESPDDIKLIGLKPTFKNSLKEHFQLS